VAAETHIDQLALVADGLLDIGRHHPLVILWRVYLPDHIVAQPQPVDHFVKTPMPGTDLVVDAHKIPPGCLILILDIIFGHLLSVGNQE